MSLPVIYVFRSRAETKVLVGAPPEGGRKSEVIDLTHLLCTDADVNPAFLLHHVADGLTGVPPPEPKASLERLLEIVWDKAFSAGHTSAVLQACRPKKSA